MPKTPQGSPGSTALALTFASDPSLKQACKVRPTLPMTTRTPRSLAVAILGALLLITAPHITSATDPSSLDYGYEICIYDQNCTLERGGYVRFGIAGQYTYSTTYWAENTTFICNEDSFDEDPFPGRSGEACTLSEPVPTSAPTLSPTMTPTIAPTPEPTNTPTTGTPTNLPTVDPTMSPTMSPTLDPTMAPVAPVTYPTPEPTRKPTLSPTTLAPTSTPQPTSSPTEDPAVVCPGFKNATSCSTLDSCTWDSDSAQCIAESAVINTQTPTPAPTNDTGLGWVAILCTNIAIIGIVLAVAALIFILIHRNKPVIQLSQLLFLKLLCVGAILVNSSIFPSAFQPESDAICIVRKWWFDLTFTFTMAIFLVKIWRVWRVFYGPGDASHVTDRFLLLIVGALVLFDVILLVLWTAIEPTRSYYDEEMDAYQCKSSGAAYALLIVSYVYLGILVLLGVGLAFKVRNLGSVIGESKQIFFIVNNILVFGIFNIIVSVLSSTSYELRVLLFAFTVFWCTVVGLGVLLWAKYEKFSMTREEILYAATEPKSSRSAGASNTTNPTPTDRVTQPSRSGNTGFVNKEELRQVSSSNAPRVKQHYTGEEPQQQHPQESSYFATPEVGLYPRHEYGYNSANVPPFRYHGGARTTQEAPVDERDIFATYNTRSYTDNARAVHVPSLRAGQGATAAAATHEFDHGSVSSMSHSSSRDHLQNTTNSSAVTPPLSFHRRGDSDFTRDVSMRIAEDRSFAGSSSSRGEPSTAPVNASTQSFSFPNTAELESHARSATASSNVLETPSSPLPARSDAQAAVKPPSNSKAATVIANGFKIGEVGNWEEYVHRETGESFWVSIETGDISSSPPNDVDLS